ncbi:MAG: DNA polymerase III subunit delta [bacterium]
MIFFLYGSDTFRSLTKLKDLKEKFLRDVDGGFLNLEELDGEKLIFADFKKEISTVSFMSAKRMIIFKNIISKNKDKSLQNNIIEYLKKDEDNETVIVFWEEDINEKEALFKYLIAKRSSGSSLSRALTANSEGCIPQCRIYKQEFEQLKGAALKRWITNAVQEKGGKIDNVALNMLLERVGSDLWQMNNELDKLISFSSDITSENIKMFIKAKYDENIFNLTDAIGSKNKKLALRLLAEQLKAGVNINYIITMLARQFRLLLEIKDYMVKSASAHVSAQSISRDLKMNSFVVGKLLGQAKMYDMADLKKSYSRLMDIDLKSKTTNSDMELLLNIMVVEE